MRRPLNPPREQWLVFTSIDGSLLQSAVQTENMNVTLLLLVAAGGAIGSVLRTVAAFAVPTGRLPWATIMVNVVGSLLIGYLIARFASAGETSVGSAHAFWVMGICGGFTTFSAFSWQTFEQMQKGDWLAATLNVILSLVVCVAATGLGWRLAR